MQCRKLFQRFGATACLQFGCLVIVLCIGPWTFTSTSVPPSDVQQRELPVISDTPGAIPSPSPAPSFVADVSPIRVVRCRPQPLGSGFHNQVIQLAKFLSSSCGTPRSGDAVRLPSLRADLWSKDLLPFESIFDVQAFASGMADLCTIVTAASENSNNGSSRSHDSSTAPPPCAPPDAPLPPPSDAGQAEDWMRRVYGALSLSRRLAALLGECQRRRDAAFGLQAPSPGARAQGGGQPWVAVHMRVERDWEEQTARLDAGAAALWPRDASSSPRHSHFYTPPEIAGMVWEALGERAALLNSTKPREPFRVLVAGAVDRMSPEFAAGNASVLGAWGGDTIVVSSHSLRCFRGPAPLSYTETAALESFLVLDAPRVVGHHLSSFFEGVLRMHDARGGGPRGEGGGAPESRSRGWTYSCSGGARTGSTSGGPLHLIPFRPRPGGPRGDAEVSAFWAAAGCAPPPSPSFAPPVPPSRMQYDRLAWGAEMGCLRADCSRARGGAGASDDAGGGGAGNPVRACVQRRLGGPQHCEATSGGIPGNGSVIPLHRGGSTQPQGSGRAPGVARTSAASLEKQTGRPRLGGPEGHVQAKKRTPTADAIPVSASAPKGKGVRRALG